MKKLQSVTTIMNMQHVRGKLYETGSDGSANSTVIYAPGRKKLDPSVIFFL